jgi:hypothetical protein
MLLMSGVSGAADSPFIAPRKTLTRERRAMILVIVVSGEK